MEAGYKVRVVERGTQLVAEMRTSSVDRNTARTGPNCTQKKL